MRILLIRLDRLRRQLLVAMLGILLAAQPLPASEADDQRTRAALNDLSHEISICAAYFFLASSVFKEVPDSSDAAKRAMESAAAGAFMLEQATEIAVYIGVDKDITQEWSRLALQEMVETINRDPRNSLTIMNSKYGEPCQLMVEDSSVRFHELLKKRRASDALAYVTVREKVIP